MSNLKDSGVLVNIDDNGICRIKLVGDLRYDSSAKGFIEFVNTKLTDEKISDIIIDTQDCDYIDSTNVGILGQIARIQTQKGAKKPVIFYKEPSKIYNAINDVDINTLYDVHFCGGGKCAYDWYENDDYKNLPKEEATKQEISEIMLEMHKVLHGLSDGNQIKFESVVEQLKKDSRRK